MGFLLLLSSGHFEPEKNECSESDCRRPRRAFLRGSKWTPSVTPHLPSVIRTPDPRVERCSKWGYTVSYQRIYSRAWSNCYKVRKFLCMGEFDIIHLVRGGHICMFCWFSTNMNWICVIDTWHITLIQEKCQSSLKTLKRQMPSGLWLEEAQ